MLGLEPNPLPSQFTIVSNGQTVSVESDDFMNVTHKEHGTKLRAYSAEPELVFKASENTTIELSLCNISKDSELKTNHSKIVEDIDGIHRNLRFNLAANQQTKLKWQLPKQTDFTFAAIGDSGGDKELAWCIQRAHDLGAKFLLHLGDFNYQEGDYDRSVTLFNNSPIPCFISIGNHDFHDNGTIYPQFLSELGPLNNAFTIGKTRFVNLDTAASMFPYGAGKRGKLIQKLRASTEKVNDTVAFTHRPLHDPLPNSTHDIGSTGERDWLVSALNSIGCKTLLSGHIHIYDRSTFMGIDNIIAGQGLGHQDLLTLSDYSKMVIGEVDLDGKVSYSAAPLSMPTGMHCHPRSELSRQFLRENSDEASKAMTAILNKSCT